MNSQLVLSPDEFSLLSTDDLDAKILAQQQKLAELKKLRYQKSCEEEAVAIELKKMEDKNEIVRIFLSIQEKLSLDNNIKSQLSHSFLEDLSNLNTSIYAFRVQLVNNEMTTRIDDLPIRTARCLEQTVNEVLNPDYSINKKRKAVDQFKNTARNSRFSHDTKVAVAAVIGGLIGLFLWVGLTVASVGVAGLITFAGLGIAALVVVFGATHFAARSDSALRKNNPHESRGSQVSSDLKALLRHRKELSFAFTPPNGKPKQNSDASKIIINNVALK